MLLEFWYHWKYRTPLCTISYWRFIPVTPNSTYLTGVIHQWNWSNLSFSRCTEVESDVTSHNNFTWSLCCHVYKHFLSGKLHLSYVACNFSKQMMVCYLGKIKSETIKSMWAVKHHLWWDEFNADFKRRSKLFCIFSKITFEFHKIIFSLLYKYSPFISLLHLLRKILYLPNSQTHLLLFIYSPIISFIPSFNPCSSFTPHSFIKSS